MCKSRLKYKNLEMLVFVEGGKPEREFFSLFPD